MKARAIAVLFICIVMITGYAGAQVVSDTASYFTLSETSVFADGESVCIVRVYIKDANSNPLVGKNVVISTSRGSDYDSITQPSITNVSGQCTGYIRSTYGGWDTVSIVCDLKNIGSAHQLIQGNIEDFSKGETQTNIDSTGTPGFIKITVDPLELSVPAGSFNIANIASNGGISEYWAAQSFKPTRNCVVDTISVYLNKTGVEFPDTGILNISLCVDNGGSPGESLVSVSVTGADMSISASWLNRDWGDTQPLEANQTYWLKLRAGNLYWSQSIRLWTPESDPYLNGILKVYSFGSVNDYPDKDISFRLYVRVFDTATYVSCPQDIGIETVVYSIFNSDYNANGQTVTFDVRSADAQNDLGGAVWYPAVNNGPINTPRKRWVQWRCRMQTDDIFTSPLVDTVTINYRAPKSFYFIPAFKIVNLSASPYYFSPNGDGVKDTTTIAYTLIDNKPEDTMCIRIYDPGHNLVKTLLNYVPETTGLHEIAWDGTVDTATPVSVSGTYVYEITAIDSLASSVTESGTIVVDLVKPVPGISGISMGNQAISLVFEFDEFLDGWDVFRSDGDTASFALAGSGINEVQWDDTGAIANNLDYYYRVIATDLAGNTNTSNIACAYLTLDGGVVCNRGVFAVPNSVVGCKDEARAFVTILNTQTFGNTINLVKIKIEKRNKAILETEGKLLPVDKTLGGAYKVTAFELNAGYAEIGEIKTWQAGNPIRLTLYYDACPQEKTGTLAIYEYSGGQWSGIGGVSDVGNQTVFADVSHLSDYCVMYQSASSFSGAKPNPFTPNGDGINDYVEVRFENPDNRKVKFYIFDLTGTKVRAKDYDAGTVSVTWDGRDTGNRVVEGGAYIWQVEMGSRVVNGVVVVAR